MRETSAQYVIQRSAESSRPSWPAGWRRTDLTTACLSIRNGERASGRAARPGACVGLAGQRDEQPCSQPQSWCKLADGDLQTRTFQSLEGGGRNQREFGDTREQIYALLIRISNFNGNEKPPCPRNPLPPWHAARINTQFILSKWINYLTCRAALIII